MKGSRPEFNSRSRIVALAIAVFSMGACSHSSYLLKAKKNSVRIESVNVLAVSYHRPEYPPAEQDDFSHQSRQLECQHPRKFWKPFQQNESAIIECLNSIGDVGLAYRFVSEVQPYLEVDEDPLHPNPECIRKLLPKIPLPREVYFLGREANMDWTNQPMHCYSSSFNVRSGQVLSTDSKTRIQKILLPALANRELKNSADLHFWLMSSIFNMLKSDEQAKGILWALPVPDAVCRTCFKDDPLFNEKYSGKVKPVFWP
jgi:hypothetical protein